MTLPTAPRESEVHSGTAVRYVQLDAAGVSLVLGLPTLGLPTVLHWGADPGVLTEAQLAELVRAEGAPRATNGIDAPRPVAILPESWTGWTGAAGVSGHRSGEAWSPQFTIVDVTALHTAGLGGTLDIVAKDDQAKLQVGLHIELTPTGLLCLRAEVVNLSEMPYTVDSLNLALPVPTRADEILDLAGRWAKERVPQRHPFVVGTHLREGRHGRTGADAATVLIAGEQSFGFDRGEAWGIHVAFSGNHQVRAERSFTGERILLGGELLLPGEVELAQGERYESPRVYATYGVGLDALGSRFHEHLRARDTHPRSARPVVMNVWEAVYFEQIGRASCRERVF